MHREAAAPSRAVLLATHQPPRIRRVTVNDAGRFGADEAVTQNDVLQAVLSQTDRSLIVPVIGASGSGKSHLVLWMRAKLEEKASANRKVIYLPKGETSLPDVIDRLLDGRTGGAFDEIRQSVVGATRGRTLAEAARRFRDEIALAVAAVDEDAGGEQRTPFRRHLKEHLPNLLDDPVYADRLIGEGGPVRRIVEQAREGASEAVAEFEAADLHVNLTAVDLEPLSQPAKTLLGDLTNPQLHKEAIEMLNEVRDACLSRASGVGPMKLVGVMRQLREELYKEQPDLQVVLMIEDFTLLQGIQHDLLEAMIELPIREGRQVLAPMTTVMAVTDGFFTRMLASSDTLRTRVAAQGHVYSLDVQYGENTTGALDGETLVSFTGRYLNAVRVGAAGLEAANGTAPNACGFCQHRDACHDAFGTSGEDEFGLYPFNAVALDRMVRSRQHTFNPRDLLAVMSQTLTAHAYELEEGRFPSSAWQRMFDTPRYNRPMLPSLGLRTQQEVDAWPKPEQRRILLTFWGGVPSDLVNLAEPVHRAFDIPLAEGRRVVDPGPLPPDPEPGPRPLDDGIEGAVLAWRDGDELQAEPARILRRTFREAIIGTADLEDDLVSPQFLQEFFGQDTDVRIARSRGAGRPGAERFAVEFDVSNDNALLFGAMLRAQRQESWEFQDGHDALVQFLARVEDESTRLRAFLGERLRERHADQEAAMALLALTGLAGGQGTTSDARGLLAAALSPKTAASDSAPDRWQVLINQVAFRREAVRSFALQGAHVSKSTTEPAGVDGARFLPVLTTLRAGWDMPPPSEAAPQPVKTLWQVVEVRLAPALDTIREVLTEWHSEVSRLAGDPETVAERAKTWSAAVSEASEAGLLVAARGFTPDKPLTDLAATYRTVATLLANWHDYDLGRRVFEIARLPWARLVPLREQLAVLEATLRASAEKAATQHSDGEDGSPVARFEQAIERLTEAVS
jgi:energy-coupling factor transporter ATP-binding protein EcfA2